MLGDGNIRYSNFKWDGQIGGNRRYGMTSGLKGHNYLKWLHETIYVQFGVGKIVGYPNINLPQYKGKVISQYYFNTLSVPIFKELHSLWYKFDPNLNKFVKIVPLNIKQWFGPIALTIWIMDDAYFHTSYKSVVLCSENFTKLEYLFLISILEGLGIKRSLSLRNKVKNTYRIHIYKVCH